MSDPALTRKVVVQDLKKGEELPCDGKIYRDSDGTLCFGMRYSPDKKANHAWRLAFIAAHEKGRGK